MFRNIIHTLGSRVLIALSNLVLLFLTTRLMGAEVKGEISLFVLNITVATLITGFAGGAALVYLASRISVRSTFLLHVLWAIPVIVLFTAALEVTEIGSDISTNRFAWMAMMESVIGTSLMYFLGKERITRHNILMSAKTLITLLVLGYGIWRGNRDFADFVFAYEISLWVILAACIWYVAPEVFSERGALNLRPALRQMLKFGSLVQFGNLAQILNYRFSYYLLEWLISPPSVALFRIGVFSAGMQVAESLWHFTRSVNTVQYAVVSNQDDRTSSLNLSLRLARLNYGVTLIGIVVLLLIPNQAYTTLFGNDFAELRLHIMLLSPGIIALAFGGAINHFFAGVGDHRFNTVSSILGLSLTLLIAYPSILYYETFGAAAATSIVYIFQAGIQYYFLRRSDHVRWKQLVISVVDVTDFVEKMKSFLGRK